MENMEPDTKAMLDCLEAQRAHVTGILAGLSDESLHRAVYRAAGPAWDLCSISR